jgi:lipoprotein-anchoring transpeptidase ErfK/SrfK
MDPPFMNFSAFRKRFVSTALLLGGAWLLASCATDPAFTMGPDGKPYDKDGNAVNPFEEGTYDHFKADKGYPKTSDVWKNDELLATTNAENSRLVISIPMQRGFLMKGDEVVIDYPVSTGRQSHPTPTGEYTILEKEADKRSNAYGKIYDAEGSVVNSDADARTDEIPEGGKFLGASMPYWMRLTWDGVGHHIGRVPRYPASHACIRGPRSVMPTVFKKIKLGTPVTVE